MRPSSVPRRTWRTAAGTWSVARADKRLTAILDDRFLSKRSRTGVVSNSWPLAIGSKYGREDSPGGRLDEVTYYVGPPDGDGGGELLRLRRQLQQLRKADNAVGVWHLDERR